MSRSAKRKDPVRLIFAATVLFPPALLWAVLWAVGWLPFHSTYATLAMILGGYAAWATFLSYVAKYGEFLRTLFPTGPPPKSAPLRPVTTAQLLSRLTSAGQVDWVDRGVTSLANLRPPHDRLILTGPMKTGKTHEAIQLIRRAEADYRISTGRIYEPDPYFRTFTADALRAAFPSCLDPKGSALLFVDDLPFHYAGDALKLFDEAMIALAGCRYGYFLATARDDELTPQHRHWLDRHGFQIIPMPEWQPDHKTELVDNVAVSFQLVLDPAARAEYAAVDHGAPEVITTGLRRLAEQTTHVDGATAQEWAHKSATDLWLEIRRHAQERSAAAGFLFQSLDAFHAARVTPYTPLVLHFAIYLWRGGMNWRRPWFPRRAQRRALAILSHYSIADHGGTIEVPDVAVEGHLSSAAATDQLAAFLQHHRRPFHNRWLRHLYPDAESHMGALFELALAAGDQKQLQGAARLYSAALAVCPHPVLYLNRGVARDAQDDVAGALADFGRAIALFPDGPDRATAYTNRGLARADQGDLAGAVADYDRAIALDPEYAVAYNNRGAACQAQDDLAEALTDYDRAIALDPEYAAAYNNRGAARHAQGDLAGALADYDRAIALDPEDAAAYYNRGLARADQGDLAGALADYDWATALDPEEAATYASRGNALAAQGHLSGALADYTRAITLLADRPDLTGADYDRGTAGGPARPGRGAA